MPICPSGSSPKIDAPLSIILTPDNASRFLPAGVNWMHDFLRFIGPLFIDVPAMCALEPPDFPDITLFDVLNLVSGGRTGGYITAAEKFNDVMRWAAWYTLCECDGAATPALPAPPAPPSNLPIIDPPYLVPPDPHSVVAGPCVTSSDAATQDFGLTSDADNVITSTAASFGQFRWGPHPGNDNFPLFNVNTVRFITRRNSVGAGPHQNVTWLIHWQTRTTFLYNQTFVDAPDGVDHVRDIIPPADATNFIFQYGAAATSTDTLRFHIDGYCNVPPGTTPVAQPCCPPDPLLAARLEQIMTMVTLLQRQGEPFAYVTGPVHSDLVDVGELDLADPALGFMVEVTTLPPELGHLLSMPEMLFDVGWVSVGTADGWERRTRIDAAAQLFIPPHMGLITRIGYSLSPNVAVRITELIREP